MKDHMELALVCGSVLAFIAIIVFCGLYDQEQKLRCLHDNLARPALEAKILCGGIK